MSIGIDSLKGGYFFDSSLTPNGMFSNIPQTYSVSPQLVNSVEPQLLLTLERIKAQLQLQTKTQIDVVDSAPLNDQTINLFLIQFVELLIDDRDLRNSVFWGSARTEMVYNVNYIVENYPFKALVGRDINLTTPITLTPQSSNTTKITFNFSDILEEVNYSFKEDSITNWSQFDVVDELGNRFAVEEFQSPSFLSFTTASTLPGVLTVDTITANGFTTGDLVTIQITDINGEYIINGTYAVTVLSASQFTVDDFLIATTYAFGTGRVRRDPQETYDNFLDWEIAFIVEGTISVNNFIEYFPTPGEFFKCLMFSPKIQTLTQFNVELSGIQKQLLSLTNPTPWPRKPITENISISGADYDEWISNPTNLYTGNVDDIGFINNDVELNLVAATSLDETYTNQLIRRAIPHRLISELNDTSDGFFQRFVQLAGKFFDVADVYIRFLKFTKHLNYGQFNQLSPEYYKLYADHYGFTLFSDDNVGLGQLLIRTEPGLRYDLQNEPVFDSVEDQQTLQKMKYEQQKRILINLLYLYRTKGTQAALRFLISALGAARDLVEIREYAFDILDKTSGGYYAQSYFDSNVSYKGKRIVENNKIKVPNITFELDPKYTDIKYCADFQLVSGGVNSQLEIELTNGISIVPVWRTNWNNDVTTTSLDFVNQLNLQQSEFKAVYNSTTHKITLIVSPSYAGWNIHNVGNGTTINLFQPITAVFENESYKVRTSEAETWNLRELGIVTTPNIAIQNDITNRATSTPNIYGVHNHRSYSNLQNANSDYWLLPLTLPDKYTNVVAKYNIPKQGGFSKSINNSTIDLDTRIQFDLVSLYKVAPYSASQQLAGTTYAYPTNGKRAIGGLTIDAAVGETAEIYVDGVVISNSLTRLISETPSEFVQRLQQDIESFVSIPEYISEAVGKRLVIFSLPFNASQNGFVVSAIGTANFNDIADLDGGIDPSLEEMNFLLCKIEDKHLVVRYRIDSEPSGLTPFDFVAIYPNLFIDDGLDHQIDLKIRLRGVEIYIDYKFIGIANWKDLTGSLYTALSIPYPEISSLTDVVLLDSLFGDGATLSDDIPYLWDLYCGNPIQCQINLQSISIIKLPSITHPNSVLDGDMSSGNESEVYTFNFANNIGDDNQFNVPVQFKQPTPNYALTNYYITTDANDFIIELSLTNHQFDNLLPNADPLGTVELLSAIQSYYDEIDLFKFNAWSSTLHKDYEYDHLINALKSYTVFSEQILTYQALLPFMNLIEGQFKNLALQFIPIVINLSEFGRLISNLVPKKIHYVDIHKTCRVAVYNQYAVMSFEVSSGQYGDEFVPILTVGGYYLSTSVFWLSSNSYTAQLCANQINAILPSYVYANVIGSTVVIYVDYDWYLANHLTDINTEVLDISVLNGTPTFANVVQPFGGQPLNTTGCFTLNRTPKTGVIDSSVSYNIRYTIENIVPPTYIYLNSEGILGPYIN